MSGVRSLIPVEKAESTMLAEGMIAGPSSRITSQ